MGRLALYRSFGVEAEQGCGDLGSCYRALESLLGLGMFGLGGGGGIGCPWRFQSDVYGLMIGFCTILLCFFSKSAENVASQRRVNVLPAKMERPFVSS